MQENTTPLSPEIRTEIGNSLLDYILSQMSRDREMKLSKQAEKNARAKGEPSL